MSTPRVEIDLAKIHHNARTLVELLEPKGITVTGVTKATLGSAEIARAMLRAGVTGLGDSRIENIERLRGVGIDSPVTLIRSPLLSQVERVVGHADVSLNTEIDVIRALGAAASVADRAHGIVLMIELGDLREGIMPDDLDGIVRHVLDIPGVQLRGIGTNLACQSGVTPDESNMAELSALAKSVEERFGLDLTVVSGGNSANLDWALRAADTGRVNDLRLGESILLGRETLNRLPIEGLHTDAITLVAEVIESKVKPSQARGELAQTAFGHVAPTVDQGDMDRAILGIGRQDVDPDGLCAPADITVLGTSSDHLVVHTDRSALRVGDEVSFGLDYSALVRTMTSPFVAKVLRHGVNSADADADANANSPAY